MRIVPFIAFVLLAQVVTLSLAQSSAETLSACYVPGAGVVYLIKRNGLPQSCRAASHVEFSWNQQGPVGPEGPAGPSGTAPAGAVVFFELAACPAGWSESTLLAGRTVVGRPAGGTLGGTVAASLTNLESRTHTHSVDAPSTSTGGAGSHAHLWSSLTNNQEWLTYNSVGGVITMVQWGDGLDAVGAGTYPIALNEGIGLRQHFTDIEPNHSHSVDLGPVTSTNASHVMPYAQLLACKKT